MNPDDLTPCEDRPEWRDSDVWPDPEPDLRPDPESSLPPLGRDGGEANSRNSTSERRTGAGGPRVRGVPHNRLIDETRQARTSRYDQQEDPS